MKKPLLIIAAGLALLVVGAILLDTYRDRRHTLIIMGSVDVLEDAHPQRNNQPENRVVAVINQGDEVKVLRIQYGKDFMAVKVSLPDGRTGYVISGDDFRLTR